MPGPLNSPHHKETTSYCTKILLSMLTVKSYCKVLCPPLLQPTTATMTDCWPLPMPDSEPAGWGCDTRGLRSTFLWLTRLT